MKKTLTIILVLILMVSILAGCGKEEPETSKGPNNVEENISATLGDLEEGQELIELPLSEITLGNIAVDFGGVVIKESEEVQYLATEIVGLYYADDWNSPEELSAEDIYYWYLTMVLKEDLEWDEIEEKYKSPFGPNTGWFFPEEYFEPTVEAYFGLSSEYLKRAGRSLFYPIKKVIMCRKKLQHMTRLLSV